MINVRIRRRDGVIVSFEANGHAGYDESGHDIVCASVSILLYNAVNSCEHFLSVKIADEEDDDGDTLRVLLSWQDAERTDVQLLLNSMEYGILQIAEQYPDYVKIETFKDTSKE